MLSVHPEVQNFGDEDETNYETDEINKEIMNEFWIFTAVQKSGKHITYNKIRQVNPVHIFFERRTSRGRKKTYFFLCKTFVRKKKMA